MREGACERVRVYTHRVPVKFFPSAELHIILGFLFLLNDSRSPESSVIHRVKENVLLCYAQTLPVLRENGGEV